MHETEKTITGIVHGDAVHLPSDHGLPEGQTVEVALHLPRLQPWGEGLRRCAGALADDNDPADRQILEEIQASRGTDFRAEHAD